MTVSRYSISVFNCMRLADGSSVLAQYPVLECGSPQHIVHQVFGVLGIALYMFGFPIFVGLALFRMHKHGLHTSKWYIEVLGWAYAPC